MEVKVKFTLYGNEYTMEIGKFTEFAGMLCKCVVDSNKNWKQFCETEFKVIEVIK